MKNSTRRYLPHVVAVALFVIVSAVYFLPAINGFELRQADITHFKGMAKEILEFRHFYGEEPLWTNSMFGGMPAFQISVLYPNDILGFIDTVVSLGLPRPINYLFLYLIGFYILLVSLKVRPWLAIVGSIAFAFSSYYFIILEAGHNSKAHAIAYMAPTLAGIVWAYRGRLLLGAGVTALFLALQIGANHVQITYYFGFMVLFFAVAKLVESVRVQRVSQFVTSSLVLLAAAAVALLSNANVLWNTYEYSKHTTRGQTELTVNPQGESNEHNTTGGLDRDYVTQWSQGIGEIWTFLIPNAYGGGSGAFKPDQITGANPQMRQTLLQSNTYWGDQPFTSGPVYMGAVVVLLFLLGAFMVRGPLKWALVATTLLTIALAWGKNFPELTNLFLDVVPMYDKFRAVTIILAITELAVPLLGFVFLKRVFDNPETVAERKKIFLAVAGGLSVILLLFAITPQSFFDFLSARETDMINAQMAGQNAAQVLMYSETLIEARADLFRADAWRSLFFVVAAGALIWFFVQGKLKERVVIVVLGALILVDMWGVDKRYLNNEKQRGRYVMWQPKDENVPAYTAQEADMYILNAEAAANPEVANAVDSLLAVFQEEVKTDPKRRITEHDKNDVMFAALRFNTNFRVLNLNNPFADAGVSYFHSSLGGYHGAKLKRIQELYDFYLGEEIAAVQSILQTGPTMAEVDSVLASLDIIDMMNVKYLIYNPQAPPIENPYAYGAAWFVSDVRMVDDADEEMRQLGNIDPRVEALVDERFSDQLSGFAYRESADSRIEVVDHLPNHIRYRTSSEVDQVAVFSEVYYPEGWQAYIDGEPVEHFRTNYLLRGMRVPAGEHVIEFRFEPRTFERASTVSTVSGIALLILIIFALYKNVTLTREEGDDELEYYEG